MHDGPALRGGLINLGEASSLRIPALSSALLAGTLTAVAASTAAATAVAATTRGSFDRAPFSDGKVPAGTHECGAPRSALSSRGSSPAGTRRAS